MSLRHGAAITLACAGLALAGAAPAPAEEGASPPTADAAVEERVHQLLEREGFYEEDVRVRVADGVVTLAGTVATASQKEEAAGVARGVRGVSEVVNELAVGELGTDRLPPTGSEMPPARP